MITPLNTIIALVMFAGTVGIVVPVIPGLLVVWAASLVWALEQQSTAGWVVLGVTTAVWLGGMALQYLVPGKRLRSAGIATRQLALAVLAGVVGFFVVPVVGAPIFFVLAIYLLERQKHRDPVAAKTATKHALKAIVTNIGIELATALTIMTSWLVGVWLTRP